MVPRLRKQTVLTSGCAAVGFHHAPGVDRGTTLPFHHLAMMICETIRPKLPSGADGVRLRAQGGSVSPDLLEDRC